MITLNQNWSLLHALALVTCWAKGSSLDQSKDSNAKLILKASKLIYEHSFYSLVTVVCLRISSNTCIVIPVIPNSNTCLRNRFASSLKKLKKLKKFPYLRNLFVALKRVADKVYTLPTTNWASAMLKLIINLNIYSAPDDAWCLFYFFVGCFFFSLGWDLPCGIMRFYSNLTLALSYCYWFIGSLQ